MADSLFEPPDWLEREQEVLASYAMHTRQSRGRKHTEPAHGFRTLYQRDRDRIVHSTAFRRLMYKTQVLVSAANDHHRTRLTHTLEVAQIARTIARQLGLNEDLTEAVALMHDLGHPPFGHAGEQVLDECMADSGGFEHNRHGLRIIELLEYRYPDFPGLNLSWEVLEAQAMHSKRPEAPEVRPYLDGGRPFLEAQVVDAADSLAYDCHDVDDALMLGLIPLDELAGVPMWTQAAEQVRQRYPGIRPEQFIPAVVRALINWQVTDLLDCTRHNLRQERIRTVDEVRACPRLLVAHSPEVGTLRAGLEEFLRRARLSPLPRSADGPQGPAGVAAAVRRVLPRTRGDARSLSPARPSGPGCAGGLRLPCGHDRSLRAGRVPAAVPAQYTRIELISSRNSRRRPTLNTWFQNWFGSSGMFLTWLLRAVFLVLVIGIATNVLVYYTTYGTNPQHYYPWIGVASFLAILGTGVLIVLADYFIRNKQITTISAVYFGLLMGFLLGSLFWESLKPVVAAYMKNPDDQDVARMLVIVTVCYITVSTLLQTKDEFRFIIPYVEFSKQVKGVRPLVLDTSVIIDGRIADICDTGFIDTKMIIPRFVLQELQGIADSSDKIKRNRGRRGLDMLKRMQNNTKVELQMHEGNLPELRDVHKVDERLVVFAKALGARVVTNDFNLNKIAQLQGVEVINLNELAHALKLSGAARREPDCAHRQAGRPDRARSGISRRRHDGCGGTRPRRDRPGGEHHRDQRAADQRRPHDFRPDRQQAGNRRPSGPADVTSSPPPQGARGGDRHGGRLQCLTAGRCSCLWDWRWP